MTALLALAVHSNAVINLTEVALGASACRYHLLEMPRHATDGALQRFADVEHHGHLHEAEKWQNGMNMCALAVISGTACVGMELHLHRALVSSPFISLTSSIDDADLVFVDNFGSHQWALCPKGVHPSRCYPDSNGEKQQKNKKHKKDKKKKRKFSHKKKAKLKAGEAPAQASAKQPNIDFPKLAVERAMQTTKWKQTPSGAPASTKGNGESFIFTFGHPYTYYRFRKLLKDASNLMVDTDMALGADENKLSVIPYVVPYAVEEEDIDTSANACGNGNESSRESESVDSSSSSSSSSSSGSSSGGGGSSSNDRDQTCEGDDGRHERNTLLYFNGYRSASATRSNLLNSFRSVNNPPHVMVVDKERQDQNQNQNGGKRKKHELGHAAYLRQLQRSKFCLVPRGDTRSSRRLFEAIVTGCVPVLISDGLLLPFPRIVNYSAFATFVPERDVAFLTQLGEKNLVAMLAAVPEAELRRRRARMREVALLFKTYVNQRPRPRPRPRRLSSLHELDDASISSATTGDASSVSVPIPVNAASKADYDYGAKTDYARFGVHEYKIGAPDVVLAELCRKTKNQQRVSSDIT
jgi:uncharacterized membrane protein YgcG